MKSNFIRYLLGGLIAACCVTTAGNASAYQMWDLIADFNAGGSSVHEFNFRTNGGSLGLQYYDKNNYGAIGTAYTNGVSLQYMADVLSSRMIWWQGYYSGSDVVSAQYVSYPLVGFVDDGAGGITFKYFINGDTPYFEDYNVPSRAGFTHTFLDGSSCLMDQVFFNVGSIIFKCSDSNKTFQIMAGGSALGGGFLYLDPFNSTNNVWYINRQNGKSWSITMDKEEMSKILYGDYQIGVEFMQNLFSTGYDSYSVSQGGSNIFPTCGLMACTTQSRDVSSVGFVYTKDLITVDPDFGGSNSSNVPVNLSGSISQKESLEEYNSCIDRYINVKDLSSFWYQCRNDYENNKLTREQYLSIENYVLDLDSNTAFSGETVTDNCFLMSDIALNMFDTHSGTYNTDVNLAWRGSSSTEGIDLSYMCGSKPSVTTSVDGVNWWQDLLNKIGIGGNSVGSGTVVDSVIMGAMDLISSPIEEYIIDPISSEYYSGYALVNKLTCTNTNNTFEYGDYILYFGVVVILFVLYRYFL